MHLSQTCVSEYFCSRQPFIVSRQPASPPSIPVIKKNTENARARENKRGKKKGREGVGERCNNGAGTNVTFNKRRLLFSSAETIPFPPFVRLHGQILSRRYERYANRKEKRKGKVEIRGYIYITPPTDCWRAGVVSGRIIEWYVTVLCRYGWRNGHRFRN